MDRRGRGSSWLWSSSSNKGDYQGSTNAQGGPPEWTSVLDYDVFVTNFSAAHWLWKESKENFRDYVSPIADGVQQDLEKIPKGKPKLWLFWMSPPVVVSEPDPHISFRRTALAASMLREQLAPKAWVDAGPAQSLPGVGLRLYLHPRHSPQGRTLSLGRAALEAQRPCASCAASGEPPLPRGGGSVTSRKEKGKPGLMSPGEKKQLRKAHKEPCLSRRVFLCEAKGRVLFVRTRCAAVSEAG